MTAGVKKNVEQVRRKALWTAAGQDWEGAETSLRLTGWGRSRRAIVLRHRVKGDLAVVDHGYPNQLHLGWAEFDQEVIVNAYAVLITSFPQEILTLAQGYRDRADAENPFDELKITGARAQVKYLRGRELEPHPPLPAPA